MPDLPMMYPASPEAVSELLDDLKRKLAESDAAYRRDHERRMAWAMADPRPDVRRQKLSDVADHELRWRQAREPLVQTILRVLESAAICWPKQFGPLQ